MDDHVVKTINHPMAADASKSISAVTALLALKSFDSTARWMRGIRAGITPMP